MQDSIPGSITGKEFNDRFTKAIQKVYDSGQSNPVVFSHKFAIEYWTMLNAKNAKDSLLTTHPLPNIGRVVLTGNPMTGWTIVEWDGVRNFSG
jgi:broad specificity phosphatase PhoE